MRVRTIALAFAGAVALVVGIPLSGEVGLGDASRAASLDPPASIDLFYTPPGLVRAGSTVRVSVDAICTTTGGSQCPVDVTLGTQVGAEPWETVTRSAESGAEFDVTDAAARAGGNGAGMVRFFLRAHTGTELATSAGNPRAPLKFWVVPEMQKIQIPAIPFGQVRKPTNVLFLPWGAGRTKAGLSPGRESLTGGPSSFDVDDRGRIHLLDTEQDRLAVFSEGELIREVRLALDSDADVSVAADGTAYVLEVRDDIAEVRAVSSSGTVQPAQPLGEALSAHVRTVGAKAYANLLPADAWVRVPEAGMIPTAAIPSDTFTGIPISGDAKLVRIATDRSIRLATVSGDEVSNAVEVQSDTPLGEVALAEPDGNGGYWCVVRVWRENPAPADQYHVLHISGEEIVESFAVSSEQFADTPPLSRFRLANGGNLYQLTTSPSGVRIVRFELGGRS
ncbi:MAG TPA: hypothetical protein VHI54_04250 [Actinomycetota bacterium]|nr:hypothetical protein [Actinomycetota bacterium]